MASLTMAVQSYFEYGMDANSNRNLIKRLLPLAGASFPTSNKGSSTYNSDNQIQTAPGRGSFTYDDNGNTLSASGTPALSFVYNPLNQLTSYTSGGSTQTFAYDVLGNRASKTAGGSTTKYIGGLVETDAGGAITAYYVYGLGLISTIRGSTPYYYQYDGLGSTVAITNSSGTIVNSYAYDDYGQVATNSVEGISNAYKYVGRYGVQTDAADLLYMRARYYMPSVGRFINKDPIGLAGGVNLYGYVGGNPISLIDPLGLKVAILDQRSVISKFHSAIGLHSEDKHFNSGLYWAGYADSIIKNAKSIAIVGTVFIFAPSPVSFIAGTILLAGSSGLAIQAYKDAWVEDEYDPNVYIEDNGIYFENDSFCPL